MTFGFLALGALSVTAASDETNHAKIPFDEIGAVAGKQYTGDGLSIIPSGEGATLRCVFQKLEGHVDNKGLWLVSTAGPSNSVPGRDGVAFRVIARSVGREHSAATLLTETGEVQTTSQTARFHRAGLDEEYAVSVDGVRQDFIVTGRPAEHEALQVILAVDGARAQAAPEGARLVLDGSGRKLAYHQLKARDVRGRELTARMEVVSPSQLAVLVDDANAEYPVRIDPTFSDANWIGLGLGGFAGYNDGVAALAVSGDTLYVGGGFSTAGGVATTNIAQWNGSSWSALGSGVGGYDPVFALAVSGDTLYVGGDFSTAGGVAATNIAQWNGSSWSALGSGLNNYVAALAVSGNTLYAGGLFDHTGPIPLNDSVDQWNGTNWSPLSPLGSGMIGPVYALAVSGSNLYAGGQFTMAGGVATNIARWDGSSWSALGAGISGPGASGNGPFVQALAVSGTNLFVAGAFSTAGGVPANSVAQWNGSSWSALGSGMNSIVIALAVSGNTLYAGGYFTTAGGVPANYIAQWNGSSWSALGSGVGVEGYDEVIALAVSGNNNLYAGGVFSTAGTNASAYVAEALLSQSSYDLALTTLGRGTNVIKGQGTPGYAYALDLATNLAPPINWRPQATNTPVYQSFVFTNVTASPQGFYRTRYVPN